MELCKWLLVYENYFYTRGQDKNKNCLSKIPDSQGSDYEDGHLKKFHTLGECFCPSVSS
jgi:hypothetical protein